MNIPPLLSFNSVGTAAIPLLGLSNLNTGLNFGVSLPNSSIINPLKTGYEQLGPVYNGPGSLRDPSPFMLMKLELEQREAVERGKKFAMEESIKSALAKQTRQQQLLQTPASKNAQTLNLLSRIYVGSISYDLNEEAVKLAFQPFGPIRSVSMSWDAETQKHKGFAFIEFEHPEAAHLAVEQMNNASLGGRQLKVGRPSNLPQADPLINDLIKEYNLGRKIYISGVHFDLSEEDLSLVFEAFGKITACKLIPDPSKPQRHRGFGYIEYETEQSAKDAIASMNMFDLGGQFLRIGRAISPPDEPSSTSTANVPAAAAVAAASATAKVLALEAENVTKGRSSGIGVSITPTSSLFANLKLPNLTSLMADANSQKCIQPASNQQSSLSWDHIEAQEANMGLGSASFEDDDGGTLEHQENFLIRGRDARNVIMQKLLRPPRGVMILRNMVGPEDCDDDLESEVKEECCNYGGVERVVIYQELDENGQLLIKIFVVFQESESVDRATNVLNGRYFAGRQVIAERYDLEMFDANDLTG